MSEITVAVVQSIAVPGNMPWSVQDHIRLASRAADLGSRIALFPELSLTGYDRRLTPADAVTLDDPRVSPLQAVADARDILIIAGAPVLSPCGLHIGALCFCPGRGGTMYLKQFLHEGEEAAFVPGSGGEALAIAGRIVCVAICADITHAEHANEAARRGAEIYAASCCLTPSGYAADAALLEGYARDHRMAVMMANYGAATGGWMSAGRSAIWSSTGGLLAQGPSKGEAVAVAALTGCSTVIRFERPDTADAIELITELEAHLESLYPRESRHGFSVDKLIAEGVAFFVLRNNDTPAGCGGIQLFGDEYGEVKRMYVRPQFRGSGFGRLILDHLAEYARTHGVGVLRLETGIHQPAAIRLYERMGFQRIPPFGSYADDPLCLYYEKRFDGV